MADEQTQEIGSEVHPDSSKVEEIDQSVKDEIIIVECQKFMDELLLHDFLDQYIAMIVKEEIKSRFSDRDSDKSSLDLGLPSIDKDLRVLNWINSIPVGETLPSPHYRSVPYSSTSRTSPGSSLPTNASSRDLIEQTEENTQSGILGSFRAMKRKAVSFCQDVVKKIRRW